MEINIAIIGLGRVGFILLQQLLKNRQKGVNIQAVADLQETTGKDYARTQSVPIKSMKEIALLSDKIDIIFELTGSAEVRTELRNLLRDNKNSHTVIATETIAALISLLLTEESLPDVHQHKGY